MCHVCDLLTAEADTVLADDYEASFPFGECHCGCPLEDNGECPACIQQAIDERAMAKWLEAHPDVVMDANR